MTKVLLIGSGAREHAIFNALMSSNPTPEIVVFGKTTNPGMVNATAYELGDIENMSAIDAVAQKHKFDMAIVGPDNPIGLGAADVLKKSGIPTFAPTKDLAQLESSKSFTRDLLKKYEITGNPVFKVFTNESTDQEILGFMDSELEGEYVVKYDALLGGKGVKLSKEHLETSGEGLAFAKDCISECGKVVVEEKFIGPEFSLLCFADGKTIVPMPIVQDHKRAYDGDIGPNTGGMGTYSNSNHLLPFIDESDLAQAIEITKKVQTALKTETGSDYCGIMYGGFIKTKNGVRLIEYNARFGDPEAMNVLPLLKSDFLEIITAATQQKLDQIKIEFSDLASVCLYLVPETYPVGPTLEGENALVILDKKILQMPNIYTFYSSVDFVSKNEETVTLNLTSSRAIAITALGESIESARIKVLAATQFIHGKVMFRTDIGSSELIQKRIDLIKSFTN
jgi:phosphoribosylamine--glycine ligase